VVAGFRLRIHRTINGCDYLLLPKPTNFGQALEICKKVAIVAVAHSILVIAYNMLSRHEPYKELGSSYYDEQKKEFVVKRLTKRIENLGYQVSLQPVSD